MSNDYQTGRFQSATPTQQLNNDLAGLRSPQAFPTNREMEAISQDRSHTQVNPPSHVESLEHKLLDLEYKCSVLQQEQAQLEVERRFPSDSSPAPADPARNQRPSSKEKGKYESAIHSRVASVQELEDEARHLSAASN